MAQYRVRNRKLKPAVGGWNSGFTMVELLVVVAITVIMMGLLLGPLNQTFNLTSRGRTMITAQDNARIALQQISREMQDAMVVYDNLPLNLWHYSDYDATGDPPRPTPKANAVPVETPVTGAMVDLVLPRMRYFCTKYNHYLDVVERSAESGVIDTRRVAIDTCPRAGHQDSPVELRPTDPLQPEDVRVRYFIALQHPLPDPNDPNNLLPGSANNRTDPHYANGFLFRGIATAQDNMYVLYRVEFTPNVNTPEGQRTRNWVLDRNRVFGGRLFRAGTPNPNFFYDPAFAAEWKSRAVALVTTADTDLIRLASFVDPSRGEQVWRPEPTARFAGTPIANETLDANSATATTESTGIQGAPRPPTQYAADYGNWSGPNTDMSLPVTSSVVMTPQPAPPGVSGGVAAQYVYGPRVQVFEQSRAGQGDRLDLVYDSGVPASVVARQRLFTFDSRRGIVNFALRRFQFPGSATDDPEVFLATVGPDYTTDLKADRATAQVTSFTGAIESVPTGFGALKQDAFLSKSVRIVPGSETITRTLDASGSSVLMERTGYSGLGVAGGDQYVAQADLQPNQYSIDYSTGVITFSDRDPTLLQARPGGVQQLLVRYQFQTNRSTDVVRATYTTRSLMTAELGLVQYEPRTGEAQSMQLTNRTRVRNTAR